MHGSWVIWRISIQVNILMSIWYPHRQYFIYVILQVCKQHRRTREQNTKQNESTYQNNVTYYFVLRHFKFDTNLRAQRRWIHFRVATAQVGPRSSHCWVFQTTHKHTHTHTRGMSPLNELSARRRGRYLHNTQQTNTITLGGIRTRGPSTQVAARPHLRPHGHRQPISPNLVMPLISLRTNGAAVAIWYRVFVRACHYEITTKVFAPRNGQLKERVETLTENLFLQQDWCSLTVVMCSMYETNAPSHCP